MIPCINQATVMKADTISFLKAARRHEFKHVELDIGKVEECIQENGLSVLKRTLSENELTVVSLNAIENYPILSKEQTRMSVERCKEIFNLSNSLRCRIVVVNPSEFTDPKGTTMNARFDAFFLEIAELARKFNVNLGFEYVSYDNRVVNTLKSTLEKLSLWGDDIGLVLDLFHLYRSREDIENIPEGLFSRLWVFHVNDAPNTPIERIVDSERVFPFEGVADPARYVNALAKRDFQGPISLELFNKKYWEMDLDLVLGKAKTSLEKLHVT